MPGWQALSLVYDGLLTLVCLWAAQRDRQFPDLATSLPTLQSNGTAYTFRLRRGVRYSDGRTVQASDFRRAIERQFRAGTGLALVGLDVLGADRCSKDRCDLSRGIVADDGAGTVTFHLTSPDPDFLFKLALPFGAAVPSGSPEPDVGGRALPATGPYMIERYRPNRTLVLVRNPRFREWSAEAQPAGYPDRLVWTFGVAPEQATTMVERGRADVMIDAPPEQRLPDEPPLSRPGSPVRSRGDVLLVPEHAGSAVRRRPRAKGAQLRRRPVGNRAPVGRVSARAADVPAATAHPRATNRIARIPPGHGKSDCARPDARSTASRRREGERCGCTGRRQCRRSAQGCGRALLRAAPRETRVRRSAAALPGHPAFLRGGRKADVAGTGRDTGVGVRLPSALGLLPRPAHVLGLPARGADQSQPGGFL